jgi:uncharacterized protein YqgC (DUF456 family)
MRLFWDGQKRFFHPYSGAVILGVDWLAFGADVPTGFAVVALTSLAAFAATFIAVAAIQRRDGDSPLAACGKAFLGALAAGVPFPVTGTIVGAWILALSGLPIGRRR